MAIVPISAHAARWDLQDALTRGDATMDQVDAYVAALLSDDPALSTWLATPTNDYSEWAS